MRVSKWDREILRLAVPSIVTNVTVPLLGLIDLAIVGHIGNETMIGAIAVGSMIFNVMYWLMGFLRMGTSGMAAQEYGAHQNDATASISFGSGVGGRALRLALMIAVGMLLLQVPLRWLSLWLMGPSAEVASYVREYYNICIWGAPAMLSLYVMTGWYIGMQDTRTPMVVSITQNIINIVVSLVLVFGFKMQIEGVALGTLIAQWSGAAMAWGNLPRPLRGRGGPSGLSFFNKQTVLRKALSFFFPRYRSIIEPARLCRLRSKKGARTDRFRNEMEKESGKAERGWGVSPIEEAGSISPIEGVEGCSPIEGVGGGSPFFQTNFDLFLRTICLVAVNLFFTSAGARQGDMLLSVNTLLMTFFTLFSYVMDGFANAGEALCGKYDGNSSQQSLQAVIRHLFRWGWLMVVLFTAVYALGGRGFVGLLTDEVRVVDATMKYLPWALLIPVAGMAAFVYDGIFIGLLKTRGMLVASAVATVAFFGLFYALFPLWGNHALWLALIVYLVLRGLVQHVYLVKSE